MSTGKPFPARKVSAWLQACESRKSSLTQRQSEGAFSPSNNIHQCNIRNNCLICLTVRGRRLQFAKISVYFQVIFFLKRNTAFMVVVLLVAIFLFIDVAGAADSLLSPNGINYEVAALMSIKNKMRDDYHVLDGWDINSVDPCTWNMVGCSAEGFVTSLDMASMGLSGTLSPSIGNLTHLHSMLIQNNKLCGSIPTEIGKLQQLQTLDLSDNQFSGEIPESIGCLRHLSYLKLSKNQLSGNIPGLVANLTGLSFLDLAFNNLSGPTPRIHAKAYSVTGNSFLCNSSSLQVCVDEVKPVNVLLSGTTSKALHHHHWKVPVAVAVAVGCVVFVSVLLGIALVHFYRSRLLMASAVQRDYECNIGHLKRFSFHELQRATGNFDPKNVLGQGGFGIVYKGCLPNKTMVAVKRLKDPNFAGEVQFQTEVEMIGLALHKNLLRLYGFCMTPNERLLVYPYMPNGSLADRLRDSCRERPTLDWGTRIRIALGAARGLLYLHEQCTPKIIHRDVKAANILLDGSFEAVVGDFGLAKLLDRRDSHVTTAVRGTIGHIAPEYLSTGQSSEKTDVFGFGILLLELITGQKTIDAGNGQVQKGTLLDWVKALYEEKKLDLLVDLDLKGAYDGEELQKVVKLILRCTQANPSPRPKMSEALKILEGIVGQPVHGEESQVGASLSEERAYSGFSTKYSEWHNYSFVVEDMELSGPR